MSASAKLDRVTISMEPELREAVEAAAEAERRPLSNFVRNLLAEHIASRTTRAEARAA
jgi:hypothetical protein